MKSTCPTKVSSPNLRRDQAVDSDGLRYDAMESALRPSLPTATRSVPLNRTFFAVDRGPNPWPLDQHDRAKHHHFDPRKQTPGGRHQIGTPAGFKSESVAGFLLECLAGFLGIRSLALINLRESGEIPWDWISDETRSLNSFTGFDSIVEGVDAYLNIIRLDRWNGDAPMILTESRSLTGVLRDTARAYGVRIAATNGQAGGFLRTGLAPHLSDSSRVLYLGDYDLAGADIEANTRRVLEHASNAALDWERLALTSEQVANYKLPSVVKSDSRFKNGGSHQAVETEALSQRLIVEIVRNRLEALLPESLDQILIREGVQREQVRALLAATP